MRCYPAGNGHVLNRKMRLKNYFGGGVVLKRVFSDLVFGDGKDFISCSKDKG
jgi:hypothetical protein